MPLSPSFLLAGPQLLKLWVIKTRSEYRISSLDCLRGPISGYDVK